MIKYFWLDNFDGGEQSKFFDTLEEVTIDAKAHVKDMRLTAYELEKLRKNCEDSVAIYKVEFDDNVNEEDLEDLLFRPEAIEEQIGSININENTLDRLY